MQVKTLARKGQTLVVIVIAMLLALSVGIAVSTGFVKRLHIFVKVDHSAKAMGAAEALVERLLALPAATLDDYAQNGTCGSNCQLSITEGLSTIAQASAVVSMLANSSDVYQIKMGESETSEVNLTGYPSSNYVDICWNKSGVSIYASYIKLSGSTYEADTYAYNSAGMSLDNGFGTATAMYGYTSCFRVTTSSTPQSLRIKNFYTDADLYIVPSPGSTIPKQGIKIVSTGTSLDTVKSLSVMVKNQAVPPVFDYVLFQQSTEEALSN